MDEDGKLEMVQKFCYLGDMIGAGAGSEEAVRCIIRCAWCKFNELAPMLTKRGLSLKMKGNLYDAYVRKVLMHGSETWAMKREDEQLMVKIERSMVRQRSMVKRMCGVSLKDRQPSGDLLSHLSIVGVEVILKQKIIIVISESINKVCRGYVKKSL